jgi:hypothetical protein
MELSAGKIPEMRKVIVSHHAEDPPFLLKIPSN